MAPFHQLRLLLWKNGLAVVRQPGWSLTVIIWPIVIFIILAVTRKQFPPVMRQPCYVGPRNLPSAGFFPFLQTLMCNTDSTCHNTSRLLDSTSSRSQSKRGLGETSFQDILETGQRIQSALMENSTSNPTEMLQLWNAMQRSQYPGVVPPGNNTLMGLFNSTLPQSGQNISNAMLESLHALKRSICTMGLTMVNSSSGHPLSYTLLKFCQSDSTLLEVSLLTLNQMLLELMKSESNDVVAIAGQAVVMFEQLQNHSALWDNLLAVPYLFTAPSVDHGLAELEALFTNIQWALHVFQESFPEAGATLSPLRPLMAGGINIINYIQSWPGRDVYITLGDVVTLHNDTLSEVAKQVLREIRIPLDKALCLLIDRDIARSYICQNSTGFGLSAACATGMVDMFLGWISPEKVAKQALLAWSKEVGPGDLSFVKGLLHSVGLSGRAARSVGRATEEPQNIDEDLFLNLGGVVIDSLKILPDADLAIQFVLRSGFFSMQTANLALNTVQNTIVNVLKDVHQLQNTYVMLMTNQPAGDVWVGQVLDSTVRMVMEILTPTGPLTCERLIHPYEWLLLRSECLDREAWKAIICQNMTNLEQLLTLEWWPLFRMVEEGYNNILNPQGNNVTLPMILTEWHKLCNNTMHLPVVLEGMVMNGIGYWMSEHSAYNMTQTLLQRVLMALASLGEDMERSPLWPRVSRYVYMASWIVNYEPGNTTLPPNCSVDAQTMDMYCNADVDWTQLVHAVAQALRTLPHKPEILIRHLKGTVNLLEHVYGDMFRELIASHIRQQIPEDEALSHYMINLTHHLHGFAVKLTTLKDSDISNPRLMLPYIYALLQSTGLTPLMSLFDSTSFNASTVLDVALKLGRQNQHLFTFNETDPTLPDLEQLITLLSMEGNLSLPLSLSMGHTLLTYSGYLRPEALAQLQLAIRPYTNKTSAGFTEAVLCAMELLSKLMDAPGGNPTDIILAYVQQLQQFLVSALRLRRVDQVWLSSGQLSTGQVTDLHLVTVDLLQLLTPEGLQSLTQAGPNATQQLIMQKLLVFLPVKDQSLAIDLLEDVLLLESQLSFCTSTGQNCVASISEIFTFLQQVVAMALAAKGNVTVQIASTNPFLRPPSSLHMTANLFSLFLPQRDAQYIQKISQVLHFTTLVMDTPHPTVSQVQDALRQSNLTLAELEEFTAMLGAADFNGFLANIVGLVDVLQCFTPQPNVTVQCAMSLISRVCIFLSELPALRNESMVFALIPTLLNKSILDAQHVNFSGNPHLPIVQVLNSTLANVKMSLHHLMLNSPEVMQEIRVLQHLLDLASVQQYYMPPISNETYQTQLGIAQWYLRKLENITSSSDLSSLLYPIYRMAELQVAIQLASNNFSMFVSHQVMNVMVNLKYPLDGAGVKQIGLVIIEIVREQMKIILMNFELQNDYMQSTGVRPMFNATTLNAVSYQTGLYLDLIRNWMREPNVPVVFNSMFHWGNSSLSTAGNDINLLLQTVRPHLNTEQMACFSAVSDVALAIHKALAAAEPAGGLQSDGFSDAILEVVRRAMRSLGAEIGPLPPELQHNVLAITAGSLRLIVNPDMSYTSARNVSLQILRRAEVLVMQILPSDVALYVTPGIQIISTYFETISLPGEQDAWNTLIFNELNTILRFLPKNSTAEAYMGMVIDITHSLVAFNQGTMILWSAVGNTSLSDLTVVMGQIQMLLNKVWPMFTEHLGLPSETPLVMGFVDLAPVLEQTMTGTANPGTWYKLEMMLNTLLSMLEGTSRWEDDGAVVLMIENILHAEVMDIQAENELIQSLQGPLLTLIAELVRSINSSHLNVSVIHEQVELAIQRTVVAAGQANESLECSQVVMLWEPVREAAGMDMDTLRAWCRVSLQPFLHSYAEDQAAYGNLNLNISSAATPGAANATAARITQSLQSLYHAEMNNSHVSEQLFFALYTQLSDPQPLSPEALVRYQIFQEMQLQQSLASLKKLSDKLLTAAPFLQSYMDAVWRATSHLLSKLQNGNRYRDIYGEAAYIFLHALNLTEPVLPPLVLGDNFTGLDGPSLLSLTREVVKVIVRTEVFGDAPHLYSCLEQFVAVNSTRLLAEAVAELLAWAPAAQVSGADALPELLSRAHAVFRALLAVLRQMAAEIPENTGYFGDLVWNLVHMAGSMAPTGDRYGEPGWEAITRGDANNGTRPPERYQEGKSRRRREAPTEPTSNFMDIFFIDYPALFKAVSVAPSSMEVLETAHMFLANPDLNVVIKGTTQGMLWDMDTSDKGEAIDGMLGVLAYLTNPEVYASPSMDLLRDMASMLGESLPFSVLIKNITRSLARESEDNMALLQEVADTVVELFQTSMMDERYPDILERFSLQVCELENMEAVRHLAVALRLPHGQLCSTVTPAVRILVQSLPANLSNLYDGIFNTLVGEPLTYNVDRQWTSVLMDSFGLNVSSIQALNVNITKSDRVAVRELLRNEAAFVTDVQRHMTFDPHVLHLLLNTTLPSNLATLSWLVSLRYCSDSNYGRPEMQDEVIYRTFCSMSAPQWYTFSMLVARHSNMEKVIYRLVMSEELQSMVGFLLRMTSFLNEMLGRLSPIMNQLQDFMSSIKDLNLMSDTKFQRSVRGVNQELSSRSMLTTVSRALCNNGIMALFGISKVVSVSADDPSSSNVQKREEMIAKFKIPRDATPFCMNLYLDMVNTTGGAIAWAFLKPMLMGEILFTPNTPITRAIMEKSNDTLREFGNLTQYSQDWIDSSEYIMTSAKMLKKTLPMLQNSLGNAFVKRFIEMQTDINVEELKETLSNFGDTADMLDKNKKVLKQITVLSNIMVNISSCIKFDRYRGYDSAEEMNTAAQDLAKNRNLYAGVIFKLPGDGIKGHKAARAASSLPPKVSYTIRMHMDNVMRTDRVRTPYFVKDSHVRAQESMRYTRGFVYLQESIDRAIIAAQAGHSVAEPAVQLQPFPYPCFLRDEYLQAISFVFPLMLMIAWILFVADFVKKLVFERELRLHEYMKMMGVNPLSHFCAWFLDCAAHLLFTIVILTLVLKFSGVLPNSDGFLLFLFFCDYGLSIVAISFLVSAFFDKTYVAGLTGSLVYVLCFFPFIIVMGLESTLSFCQKSALGLLSPTCFSYATQYVIRYEAQGEGINWGNAYISPMAKDSSSFGWMCWLLLIDSLLYFLIGAYVRMVFPGQYGIAAPWYFPVTRSFWAGLCSVCRKPGSKEGRGLLFTNILQTNQPVFAEDKEKDQNVFSSGSDQEFQGLPVGVALHRLTKMYGDRMALRDLDVSFYEGHVTSLLGHNGAGKTTTMSLLTGLFAPSSGSIEVYGRDMLTNIEAIRKDLGVCMQYDVLFDHMTTKEHLLLYGQIKAPQWTRGQLHEQVHKTLEETGMYAHRHKRVGTLSGGMKRKLSISIAFIGGSRLVVLDEPTTGVDPCSRRNIWDIVIQHKSGRTIIMSTHHLDEAEVLSDRIAFLESGGLKCCGSPLQLKDQLGQGYKLTLTRKAKTTIDGACMDPADLKAFIQSHVPEARLKEAQGSDLVYNLPPFTSSSASSYRSLLSALDANLDALQLGCYGISDTTLEEVFLQLTQADPHSGMDDVPLSISEAVSDTASIDSFSEEAHGETSHPGDKIFLTGSTVRGAALVWQQVWAMLVKRFHHSRRDWKGLLTQVLLPVIYVMVAMGLSSVKSDLQHYPEMELSPTLYNIGPSYSFFSNRNPNSSRLVDSLLSFPGIDKACLGDRQSDPPCSSSGGRSDPWESRGNASQGFMTCKCSRQQQVCSDNTYQPPHKKVSPSQTIYNLTGLNVENYLIATANNYIRNRYGGFDIGQPLPLNLRLDLQEKPKNRSLAKVWFNPEGHHSMPAYLNSLNNFILRSNLPAGKDRQQYAISISSHPYFGRADDEDAIINGMIQILVALCVLTGYAIMTSSFAVYEVYEHHSGAKRLQHISGVGEPLYWIVNFFYDMVLYLFPVLLTVAVIAAFQVPAFTDRQNLSAVTLLLLLFGFATFPWMYLLAGVFKNAEMAFISYVCINLFISINTVLPTSILYFMGQLDMTQAQATRALFQRLSRGLLVFPQFSFGNGLMALARTNMEVQILSGYGVDAYKDPFSAEGLGPMFVASVLQGLVFFALRLLLNRGLIRKVRRLILGRKAPPPGPVREQEDEDVAAEHERVSGGAATSDLLQVCRLSKVYRHLNKSVHAVKHVSLGIPAGECFGLLGVNGAGKTTTFKMLTGDISPTDGTAQIKDADGLLVDIMECRDRGINIGYCPQVDALDHLLTGKEHLYFYARIRGIPKREIDGVVNNLLKKLELTYHRDNVTESYSCGTRRKLSTALALIGHPQILLLDEPSSGMDPRTKRHLWKIISEEVKGKCAVVLTSHSMEECEALCSRLAIMVQGQFQCLGSLQHIKNRFGSGFTLKMYMALASCDVDAITAFMQLNFPSTYLKDQHSTMVEYHVPVAPGGVADIFHKLESNKKALHIKHFSISQTTLDEVFINFAMGKIGTVPIHSEDTDSLDSFEAMQE